jgi:hypothetical protein
MYTEDDMMKELYASIEEWDKDFERFTNKTNAHHWYILYKMEQTRSKWFKKLYFDLLREMKEKNND